MIEKMFDFSEVCLCGKLRVNFHSVAVKDKSCTYLWPNLNFPLKQQIILA